MPLRFALVLALLCSFAACADDTADATNDALGVADALGSDALGSDAVVNDVGVNDVALADVAPGTCPPEGPFGVQDGETLPNLTLQTCEGEPYELHSLCESDASVVIGFAEWCTRCARRAPDLQELYETLRGESADVEMVIVVTENSLFESANADTCVRVRERFGFTMPVVFDASDAFEDGLMQPVNDSSIVLDDGMRVVSTSQNRSAQLVGADLRALLR